MTYEEINAMMAEMNLPYAYHHFAEGESPEPPFLLFLTPSANPFGADNMMYYSSKRLTIELYTDKKSPSEESRIENVLTAHEIFFEKSEVFIESERLYEVIYEMEV
jgi:hypothetical protein